MDGGVGVGVLVKVVVVVVVVVYIHSVPPTLIVYLPVVVGETRPSSSSSKHDRFTS
jgi:hypothetical protein